jgi:RND family efflux transporter MFP subunit
VPTPRVSSSAALLCALVMTVLAGCDGKSAKTEAPPPPPPPVEVVEVTPREVPIESEWIATLDGSVNAVITAQVNGYLTKRTYEEGSLVKKGDVLFEIDDRPFKASLDKAKGDLARARAGLGKATLDVERYTPLARESAISQQELDDATQAKASWEAAMLSGQAVVDKAELDMAFCRVLAPIDGVAGISKAQTGDLVGPGTGALTSVSTVDPIRAYVLVSEQEYLKRVAAKVDSTERGKGVNFDLILSNGTKWPQPGRFLFVDRSVNVRTGTLTVATEFPNPANILRPGQYARLRAVLEKRANALVVPQRAVGERQGVTMCAVLDADKKVTLQAVKTAERVGSDWIITSGLKPGDRVVAEGLQKVRPGVVVDPRPYTPPAAEKAPPAPAG